MDFDFHIQDPTHPETTYLYEAILAAALEADHWRGIYAFASRNGVDQLVEDQVIQDLIHRGGEIDLIVGIDAVTNRGTLERLQELGTRHRQFRPRVFWNGTGGLFHPKLSHFRYGDGRQTIILGSGNLTPGGLAHNYEGYVIVRAEPGEGLDVASLEDFLNRQSSNIRVIDEECLERAARNVVRAVTGVARPRVTGAPVPAARPPVVARPRAPSRQPAFNRVLVAQVPAAGGRWGQVHFNADVVEKYFHITDHRMQRVYLTRVDSGGARGEEEVRPCIFAPTNRNHKIEISAARGRAYPSEGPPILVFRERQVRGFDYILLMPDETGYVPLRELTENLPQVGRGFPRVVTDIPTLQSAWPACPLLAASAGVEQDV